MLILGPAATWAGSPAKPIGTVVMVHGAGGGGWEWDLWKPVFESAGWQVIARDLKPVKAGIAHTTFNDYVRQVIAWCSAARAKPVVLIGASMGGILALKAAEKVRPAAVVLVNSVPPAGIGWQPPTRPPSPPVVEWSKGTLKETRDAMPDSTDGVIRRAFKLWRDESGAVMNEIRSGVNVSVPACPILVVLGKRDTDVSPSSGREIARAYRADILEFAGMSHVGPLLGKRAKEVASLTRAWISSRPRNSR